MPIERETTTTYNGGVSETTHTNQSGEAPTVAERTYECTHCNEAMSRTNAVRFEGEWYCEDCYDELVYHCENCGEGVTEGDIYSYNGQDLCGSCYENTRERENEEEDGFERGYEKEDSPKYQSDAKGKYINTTRIFSCEVEAYYPEIDALREVAESVPEGIGISHDGSLNENGIEFQTPKLKGRNGENTVMKLCQALNEHDFKVDSSTGLHVHIDCADMSRMRHSKTGAIQALWAFYLVFEDVLLSFLPQSRRKNSYCMLVKDSVHFKEILQCGTVAELEELWYRTANSEEIDMRKANKYDQSRYMGVNLHSLFANGHLEIRYHSGTMNPVKILEWANVHSVIVDKAVTEGLGFISMFDMARYEPTLPKKTALFFEVLGLPAHAREYFLKRQAMFTEDKNETNVSREGEDALVIANTTPICAE